MEWIKEGLTLLIGHFDKEQKEFEKYNSLLVLSRIRLISLTTIFLSIFWFYMDWKIINNGADRTYVVTLIVMHLICIFASAVFLIFYKRLIGKKENSNYRTIYFVSKVYVFLYILFGALSSINSQRYTGNIYTYIILALIAAIAFALKPSTMLFSYGVNHVIFLLGVGVLCKDENLFLVLLINSTVLVCAAFFLGFIFYRHRMIEFICRKNLMENEANFKKLFYDNPYPVFITKLEDGKIVEANKRACSLMGINVESLDSFNRFESYIKDENRLALKKELKEHSRTFNRIVEYEFNGKRMWVTANYELIDYHGEKCILTGIMDITEIRKAEEELTHYASIDSLTGILNRRMGYKKLNELLKKTKEESIEFTLCFVDINNLKYVNDTYGHREGDRYILTFCNAIKNNLKEEDIFFRMGGDEFIIVFMRNQSEAENVWNEIKSQFNDINQKNLFPYNIMASHGLFYYCTGMNVDIDLMIEEADKLMYIEKQKFKKDE